MQLYIDPDICKAHTLPAAFYLDDDLFSLSRERIFRESWQFAGTIPDLSGDRCVPGSILPGLLDEAVLLVKQADGRMLVLSNVCTHRGNLLVTQPGNARILRCGYHGRCFGLDGQCRSMPAFEGVEGFPSGQDNLKQYDHSLLGPMIFLNLGQSDYFPQVIRQIRQRMPGYAFDKLIPMPGMKQVFEIDAHWALYVDNYLEGFHVPYVHPGLNDSLEMDAYHYEVFSHHNLQLGLAKKGESKIDLSGESPDRGRKVFAYYWWIWPNLMLNCYPWGVSLNIVKPVSKSKTLVEFKTYLFDPGQKEAVSQTGILQTELEDEEIVMQVQQGIRSSAYDRGRYSPVHEKCVHHFHRLIAHAM